MNRDFGLPLAVALIVVTGVSVLAATPPAHATEFGPPTRVVDLTTDPVSNAPSQLVSIGNVIYFAATTADHGQELFRYDNASGQTAVIDINPGPSGSNPVSITASGGRVFLFANDGTRGHEPFLVDGTAATAAGEIQPGRAGSFDHEFGRVAAIGNTVYFSARSAATGTELFSAAPGSPAAIVSDIIAGPVGSVPSDLAAIGLDLVFTATRPDVGREVFGRISGAVTLVHDIVLGTGGSFPSEYTSYGNRVFFSASASGDGREVFSSDLVAPPTKFTVQPGPGGSMASQFEESGGDLYFAASGSGSNRELWRFATSAGPPVLVSEIMTGGTASDPDELRAVGPNLYFRATRNDVGRELFLAVGPDAFLLTDIATGPTSSNPTEITPVNGRVYFRADRPGNGQELFRAGGPSGERLIADLNPGPPSSNPFSLVASGPNVFFSAFSPGTSGLWRSNDPTRVTTPLPLPFAGNAGTPIMGRFGLGQGPVTAGSRLFFRRGQPSVGGGGIPPELYTSDGTAAGTRRVKDIFPGGDESVSELVPIGDRVLFSADDGARGRELWVSDGTEAGTVLLVDIHTTGSADPFGFKRVGALTYFSADDGATGRELWRTDGTAGGTARVTDIAPNLNSSHPQVFGAVGNRLLFAAEGTPAGRELWGSGLDGSSPALVADISPGIGSGLEPSSRSAIAGDLLYVRAQSAATGFEIVRSDGTGPGTSFIDVNPGQAGSFPIGLTALGPKAAFSAFAPATGRELYGTDGSPSGTTLVTDIATGAASSNPEPLASTGGRLLFKAGPAGTHLYSTTLVDGATSLLGTNRQMAEPTYTAAQEMLDGVVLSIGVGGGEPWFSDGTPEGTREIADVLPGTDVSGAFGYTLLNGRIYFVAGDALGTELWSLPVSDIDTALALTALPATAGGESTLTALVAGLSAGLPRAGTVTFRVDGVAAGTVAVGADGRAVISAPVGCRSSASVTADYSGDSIYSAASAAATAPIAGSQFLFAEGTVRPGFVQYLTLQNPGVGDTTVVASFQAADDAGAAVAVPALPVAVPARSRVTVNVNNHIAASGITVPLNISTKVTSPGRIVAERPVYFSADPALGAIVDGGTTVIGACAPAREALFAEGTVRAGFVEYLTIQNPGATAGVATIELQAADDSGTALAIPPKVIALPATSRVTVRVNDHLAASGTPLPANVSVRIRSDVGIVAERPLYFAVDPALGAPVDGGTTVVGVTGPATSQSFAEGTVRPGFVEYLTIQNPGATAGTATLRMQAANDSGAAVPFPAATVALPAASRVTVRMNDLAPSQPLNVSVQLDTTVPVVAERPIYFNADPGLGLGVDGGHTVPGTTALATTHLFAEGTVRTGFVEYLTLQNPSATAGTATLAYQAANDSGIGLAIPDQVVALPAQSRTTVRVNDHLAARVVPLPANVSVQVTADVPIAAERPVYFNTDPGLGVAVDGGHDTVGYSP